MNRVTDLQHSVLADQIAKAGLKIGGTYQATVTGGMFANCRIDQQPGIYYCHCQLQNIKEVIPGDKVFQKKASFVAKDSKLIASLDPLGDSDSDDAERLVVLDVLITVDQDSAELVSAEEGLRALKKTIAVPAAA